MLTRNEEQNVRHKKDRIGHKNLTKMLSDGRKHSKTQLNFCTPKQKQYPS